MNPSNLKIATKICGWFAVVVALLAFLIVRSIVAPILTSVQAAVSAQADHL
jgi:flagellar biosynthesis/type III secretory pathway M-ring protein FliF/YscJ